MESPSTEQSRSLNISTDGTTSGELSAPSLMDEDDVADFIPSSLISFVQEAQSTLQKSRQNFLDDISNDILVDSFEDDASTPLSKSGGKPFEDETDMQLKDDILKKFDKDIQGQDSLETVPSDDTMEKAAGPEAVEPEFWSPELKNPHSDNPVNNMTDSEVRREATAGIFSPTATMVTNTHGVETPVIALTCTLPEEAELMNVVTSINMANTADLDESGEKDQIEVEMTFGDTSQDGELPDGLSDNPSSPLVADTCAVQQEGEEVEIDFGPHSEDSGFNSAEQDAGIRGVDRGDEVEIDFTCHSETESRSGESEEKEIDFGGISSSPGKHNHQETEMENCSSSQGESGPAMFSGLPLTSPLSPSINQSVGIIPDLDSHVAAPGLESPTGATVVSTLSHVTHLGDVDETDRSFETGGAETPSPMSVASRTTSPSLKRSVSPKNSSRKGLGFGGVRRKPVGSSPGLPQSPSASKVHGIGSKTKQRPDSGSSLSNRLSQGTAATRAHAQAAFIKQQAIGSPMSTDGTRESSSNSDLLSHNASKKITSPAKSQSLSARLSRPTAAMKARTQKVRSPSTAVSSLPGDVETEKDAQEARAKAQERVRQRREKEKILMTTPKKLAPKHMSVDQKVAMVRERALAQRKEKQQSREKIERKQPVAKKRLQVVSKTVAPVERKPFVRKTVVPKKKKSSVDDKIEKARQRARQRQQELQAAREEKIRKQEARRQLAIKNASKVISSQRSLTKHPTTTARLTKISNTVPKTPKFATTAKLGTRNAALTAPVSMANSTDILRKGLRQDMSVSATPKSTLTNPSAPIFATTKRHGEKLMMPGGKSVSTTLAQSTDFLRSGLRQDTPTRRRTGGLTIPQGPKFHKTSKRAIPKSTEEREKEMMDKYAMKPFKAAPIMKREPFKPKKRPVTRAVTQQVPFSFRQSSAATKGSKASTSARARDVEMTPAFKARPMPNFSKQPSGKRQIRIRTEVTARQPFHLSSHNVSTPPRLAKKSEVAPSSGDGSFHARPVPKSTYEYQPPVTNSPSTPKTTCRAPNFATSKRTSRRREISEASHKRAESLTREKKEAAKARLSDDHERIMKQAANQTSPRPSQVEPFCLQSTERHEKYQQELKEKIAVEEMERSRQAEFVARPYIKSAKSP